jgi:hypothetical protein
MSAPRQDSPRRPQSEPLCSREPRGQLTKKPRSSAEISAWTRQRRRGHWRRLLSLLSQWFLLFLLFLQFLQFLPFRRFLLFRRFRPFRWLRSAWWRRSLQAPPSGTLLP